MRKIILAVLAIAVVGCHWCRDSVQSEQFGNPCLSKNVVCIDPKSLHASQDPLHIHGGDTAHFFITDGDGTLTISYPTSVAAIGYVKHEGSHVWVKTNPVREVVHVTYTIDIRGRTKDPEMVIEP